LAAVGPKQVRHKRGYLRPHAAMRGIKILNSNFQASPVVQANGGKYVLRGQRRGQCA